ncbi:MAG: outer membrane beta-barrel protein [Bacteroidia bacterium]|nr:outer membrane beta-barrel protein [Bacteroidia bacterium]
MKKLLFLLFSAFFLNAAAGEDLFLRALKGKKSSGGNTYIVIGARGGPMATWFFNKNVIDDDGIQQKFSGGAYGGGMLGLHLTEMVAINGEFLFASYNRKWASGIDTLSWTSRTNLKYMEIPVLLHLDFEGFKYLELGIKFGILNSAKESFDSDYLSYSNEDVKKYFSGNSKALVFGWGTGLFGSGGLLLSTGVRLTYGLDDIISDEGGRGDEYYPMADPTKPKSYQKTNLITAAFHLSLDFDLGWVVKSSCGRNYKFTLFQH